MWRWLRAEVPKEGSGRKKEEKTLRKGKCVRSEAAAEGLSSSLRLCACSAPACARLGLFVCTYGLCWECKLAGGGKQMTK